MSRLGDGNDVSGFDGFGFVVSLHRVVHLRLGRSDDGHSLASKLWDW
jgi:hypothetical protein